MSTPEQLITDNLDIWSSAVSEGSARGRGNSKKTTLYGIHKLRKLILEMGVRGLLGTQDSSDEPASQLLQKVIADKSRLITEKKIKRPAILPKISEQERQFSVPTSWELIRLGEVGYWAIGSGFPKSAQGVEGEEYLFSKVSDMNLLGNEKYLVTTLNTVSLETAENLKFKIHPKGTVFFPKIGGAIATNKRRIITRPSVIDNNCLGIVPYMGIGTEYLYLMLTSINMVDYQAGTSVPALSQSVLELIPVALPPLLEQERIVAKVDELMVLCDALETQQENSITAHQALVETLLSALTNAGEKGEFNQAWSKIAEHFDTLFTTEHSIDRLKQTILQLAVMGKLVPQDPSDEPANVLLEKITAEKEQLIKDKKIKKNKSLLPVSNDEKLFEAPEGWDWVRLQDLVYLLGDGLHGTPEYTPNEKYYFVNGNNLKNGSIVIKDETKTVAQDQYDKYKKMLGENTVLVSINGTLGNVAFYNNEDVVLGKSACYFNLAADIYKHYIKLVIESPSFIQYAFKNATGSTIKNLGLKAMNNLPIALPPKEEKLRIVNKVTELVAICDDLKFRIIESRFTQLHLADSIVKEPLGNNAKCN